MEKKVSENKIPKIKDNKKNTKEKNISKNTKNKNNNRKKITNKKTTTKQKVDNKQKNNKIKNTKNQNKREINNKLNNKKKNNTNKISYKDLTIGQIEKELKRETYKSKYNKVLMTTIYSLIIVAAVAALIATLVMPVLQISGTSMYPTYDTGDIVLSIKTKNLKSGDIIAFYHGNKILVKRVIAGAGNWINIDETGKVYINGLALEENYVEELNFGESDIEYPYQVPDGHWFVLSDDRTNYIDSRNKEIGSISEENIIGKILIRIWPLN